ncbi:MAG: 5'/3'-nucleotidase SurE [Sporomusaceae bacterium]|nr:5'/3'-nucleotidase SurE [Sporomusaceae bacterium]
MRILVTNDDGIQAQGILTLSQALSEIGQVYVAAPDVEKSATSQAITVHEPIRVDSYELPQAVKAWKIGGTPTDCVKLALEELLLDEMPHIVVSGINHGPNLGTDVLYSGTVSAAIEGILHGIPAIAFSLNAWDHCDFTVAANFAKRLVPKVVASGLPPHTLLNVNIPALPPEQISGVAITKLGSRQYENSFEERKDPRGRSYYWMGGNVVQEPDDKDSDVTAVKEAKIAVTPVHIDLTHYPLLQELQTWNFEK